jgi:hypothetical protein
MCKCGKPAWHFVHGTKHPATKARSDVHPFESVGTPNITHDEDRDFNNVNPSLDSIFEGV